MVLECFQVGAIFFGATNNNFYFLLLLLKKRIFGYFFGPRFLKWWPKVTIASNPNNLWVCRAATGATSTAKGKRKKAIQSRIAYPNKAPLYRKGVWGIGNTQQKRYKKKRGQKPLLFCTQSRGRTGTGVNLLVFETSASTDSAIWACDSSR